MNFRLSMQPVEDDVRRATGQLTWENQEDQNIGKKFRLSESEGVKFSPFDLDFTESDTIDVEIFLERQDSSHHFTFTELSNENDVQVERYSFTLPPSRIVALCDQYIRNGLTPELKQEIVSTFNKNRSAGNLLEFVSNAKYCLDFEEFINLLNEIAEEDATAKSWLSEDRHKFFKNLLSVQKAGSQYPVISQSDFEHKIQLYEDASELSQIEPNKIVRHFLDNSRKDSSVDIRLLNNIPDTLEDVIGDLSKIDFVHLLSASVVEELEIEDQDVAQYYFEGSEIDHGGPVALLMEEAYNENPDISRWESAMVKAARKDHDRFGEACANYLYWFGQNSDECPISLAVDVYKASRKKFAGLNGDFSRMINRAEFWQHYLTGIKYQNEQEFERAREYFEKAESIAARQGNVASDYIDRAATKKMLVQIEAKTRLGHFQAGLEIVEEAKSSLKSDFGLNEDDYHYQLLEAWEYDLHAEKKTKDGDFDSALADTQKAATKFEEVDELYLAEIARVREFQIRAYTAHSECDFTEAKRHHEQINSENFELLPPKTKRFHQFQSELCRVKSYVVNGNFEEAEQALSEIEDDWSRDEVVQLRMLFDTFMMYLNGAITDISDILQVYSDNPETERFRSFEGDYISTAIFISFAQRWKQNAPDDSHLDEMVREAVRAALRGGDVSDWERKMLPGTEESELKSKVIRAIERGEGERVEFKETLKYHVHKEEPDTEMQEDYMREILAMANADGGLVIFGVDDDKQIRGLDRDLSIMKHDLDNFFRQLSQGIKNQMGEANAAALTDINFVEVEGETICAVSVESSENLIFDSDGKLIVRQGTSKRTLSPQEAITYAEKVRTANTDN